MTCQRCLSRTAMVFQEIIHILVDMFEFLVEYVFNVTIFWKFGIVSAVMIMAIDMGRDFIVFTVDDLRKKRRMWKG
jgi:hypothetical protein